MNLKDIKLQITMNSFKRQKFVITDKLLIYYS